MGSKKRPVKRVKNVKCEQTFTRTVSVPITNRTVSEPNLSVKRSVTVGTIEFFLVNLILSDLAI